MSTIVVASSQQDAEAVEAVIQHHAQLAGALARHVEKLINSAIGGDEHAAEKARMGLIHWCDNELIPHALAEEISMYPLAHEDSGARLLVDAMVEEHRGILALIEQIRTVSHPVLAAARAKALGALFDSHLVKENEQILPLLAASKDISLAEVLEGMHELLGGAVQDLEQGCGGECTCGEQDSLNSLPELDARQVPHAIRHATIFGALDSIGRGGGMVLVAPHDPLPLLQQLETRSPGDFNVSYLERGPEAWKIQFLRS
jgi:uncharacterized protein (DUF2249 family)/iron-sulfur cluster repair protein YtfE (RIC family)